MSTNERPGVYTTYEVSGNIFGGGSGAAVGLVAHDTAGENGKVFSLGSIAQARENFGGGELTKLAEVLFRNGAPKVYAYKIDGDGYGEAFAALMEYADIRFMVHDSRDAEVHAALKTAIGSADERGKYRIGVVESDCADCAGFLTMAAGLNDERMLLAANWEAEGTAGSVAAALCGAMAAEEDPAVPLNGLELKGLGGMGAKFSDAEISQLIAGGVTPIEVLAGVPTVVRGVSTRTKTGDAADLTWRDINTVMILDEVIPTIRDGLRAKFARAKNNAQTRGAVRTYVLVALESYMKREIIDSYGEINVSQSGDDPGICLVGFSFTVAHGMNRIELHASISV